MDAPWCRWHWSWLVGWWLWVSGLATPRHFEDRWLVTPGGIKLGQIHQFLCSCFFYLEMNPKPLGIQGLSLRLCPPIYFSCGNGLIVTNPHWKACFTGAPFFISSSILQSGVAASRSLFLLPPSNLLKDIGWRVKSGLNWGFITWSVLQYFASSWNVEPGHVDQVWMNSSTCCSLWVHITHLQSKLCVFCWRW